MNAASLYRRSNNVQRHDAKEILKEYATVFKWRLDGEDSLLDIGCGSGDVLIDFILPIMPQNFKIITGVDISENMINFAKNTYTNVKNVEFKVLNIEENLNISYFNKYNHITSFYCWHWIQKQRKAMENLYNILQKDGECLITFLGYNPVYDVYTDLSQNPKWEQYMTDLKNFISPFQYNQNRDHDFKVLMKSVGFETVDVKTKSLVFVYEGLETLKANNKAVNPFVSRLPIHLQNDFMDDYIKRVMARGLSEKKGDDYIFPTPYKLVVAYAKK